MSRLSFVEVPPLVMNDSIHRPASRLASASAPMRIVGLILVILLLFGGCLSQLPPPTSSPQPMCHAPGGGYVPCNFGYHGSPGA